MPRKNNLTDAGRRKAAAKTNAIAHERKVKRQEEVKRLLTQQVPKQEIARQLGVRRETISRDVKEILTTDD